MVGRLSCFLYEGKGNAMLDEVIYKIIKRIEKDYDIGAIRDGLGWLLEHYDEEALRKIRELCILGLKVTKREEYFEHYKIGLLISAPHDFDCYMQ